MIKSNNVQTNFSEHNITPHTFNKYFIDAINDIETQSKDSPNDFIRKHFSDNNNTKPNHLNWLTISVNDILKSGKNMSSSEFRFLRYLKQTDK